MAQYINFFWSLFSDIWILMRYIFQRFGLSLAYLVTGMVIVTALFNYVFSPFLKGTGFLSSNKSSKSSRSKSSDHKSSKGESV